MCSSQPVSSAQLTGQISQRTDANRILNFRAVDHQPLKFLVSPSINGIDREAFDGAQRFPHRVLPVGSELIALRLGVREHNLARQGRDGGRIIVLAGRVQTVQVAHEGGVRLVQTGDLGPARCVSPTNLSAAVSRIDPQAIFAISGGRRSASATNEVAGHSTAGRGLSTQ